jgi:hypothetical protein
MDGSDFNWTVVGSQFDSRARWRRESPALTERLPVRFEWLAVA